MTETATSEHLIEKYGEPKRIRYLVNSTYDFRETITTVNHILAQVRSLEDIRALQEASNFSIIPLPGFLSKFIVCYDVPISLLGQSRGRPIHKIDFKDCSLPETQRRFNYSRLRAIFTYGVSNLLELNLAMTHFDRSISRILTSVNRLELKRSIQIQAQPPLSGGMLSRVDLVVPDISSREAEALKAEEEPPVGSKTSKAAKPADAVPKPALTEAEPVKNQDAG